jgi:hypothetical protein
MGRDSHGRRAKGMAQDALSNAAIFATVQAGNGLPRPVVISQTSDHGLALEGVGDLPVGCEVTILLRNIGRIRGRVEAFGQGRLLAGFYVSPANANGVRAA